MAINLDEKKVFLQDIEADWINHMGVKLQMLRLDKLHPYISGNKWYKLRENIKEAKRQNKSTLLTFGGVWSNHLVATAAAAEAIGMKAIGLVRQGYGKEQNETETIKFCRNHGMQVDYLNNNLYKEWKNFSFYTTLQGKYPDAFIVPEGGNNATGRRGVVEIAQMIPAEVSHVALAVGTGTTFAGLRLALDEKIKLLGFLPFKRVREQENELDELCANFEKDSRLLFPDIIWNGFGQFDNRLLSFMNYFYKEFETPLDVVYTSKMMYYLKSAIESRFFPTGSHILAIHTGGLQGNASVREYLDY